MRHNTPVVIDTLQMWVTASWFYSFIENIILNYVNISVALLVFALIGFSLKAALEFWSYYGAVAKVQGPTTEFETVYGTGENTLKRVHYWLVPLCFYNMRRRVTANPMRPRPRSANEAGSGTSCVTRNA